MTLITKKSIALNYSHGKYYNLVLNTFKSLLTQKQILETIEMVNSINKKSIKNIRHDLENILRWLQEGSTTGIKYSEFAVNFLNNDIYKTILELYKKDDFDEDIY